MLIRAFIAIELSTPIQAALSRVVGQLCESGLSGVRWVKPAGIHLTLRFLGDSKPETLTRIRSDLETAARQVAPFELQVRGLGAFPNIKHPRVIWVGVHAPPSLKGLQQSVETIARKAGYPAEERPFSPHLTLGRVQHSITNMEMSRLSAGLSGASVSELGSMLVNEFALFRSDLKPDGAVYTRLANFELYG